MSPPPPPLHAEAPFVSPTDAALIPQMCLTDAFRTLRELRSDSRYAVRGCLDLGGNSAEA